MINDGFDIFITTQAMKWYKYHYIDTYSIKKINLIEFEIRVTSSAANKNLFQSWLTIYLKSVIKHSYSNAFHKCISEKQNHK